MSKTVTQEITEFQVAVQAYDKSDLMGSAVRITREGMDVIGKLAQIDDDPAVLNEFADAVTDVVSAFVGDALQGRPFMRNSAKAAIPFVVPALVQEAAKYVGKTDAFVDAHVLPFFSGMEQIGHDGRVAFGG